MKKKGNPFFLRCPSVPQPGPEHPSVTGGDQAGGVPGGQQPAACQLQVSWKESIRELTPH